jgi:hypothetical protein
MKTKKVNDGVYAGSEEKKKREIRRVEKASEAPLGGQEQSCRLCNKCHPDIHQENWQLKKEELL